MIRTAVTIAIMFIATPLVAQDYQAPAGIDAQPLPAPAGVPESNGPVSLMPPASLMPAQIAPVQAAPVQAAPQPMQSDTTESSAMPVSPREGPQERALDQSLGLPTTYVPASAAPDITPSANEDAAIEARINAESHGKAVGPAGAVPAVVSPVLQPAHTETIYAPASHPSTVAPASSRWEGPEERALDRAVPGTDQLAPQGVPATGFDFQDEDVRRLNGGR